MTAVRKGQAPDHLSRAEFGDRFRREFIDPAFRAYDDAIAGMEQIAWEAYGEGRKAPITEKAGPEFEDPDYDLSVEWRETRDRIRAADAKRRDSATISRVLVVCGSSRNDGTCPGEVSKTFRLSQAVCEQLRSDAIDADLLDLSHLASARLSGPSRTCGPAGCNRTMRSSRTRGRSERP
jgi:hypothetical protein